MSAIVLRAANNHFVLSTFDAKNNTRKVRNMVIITVVIRLLDNHT